MTRLSPLLQLAQHQARPVELRSLATRARFGEAGPLGLLQLEILWGEVILDSNAAALERAAATNKVVGCLQRVHENKYSGGRCLRAEQHRICDRDRGTGQLLPQDCLEAVPQGQLTW